MTDALRETLQQALGTAYRIERELGGGGMSRVFVAHDLSLDREVVVKVLTAESTNGVSGDRFRREIQVIAKLQHPHIVSILAAGAADGALYYVMPYVKGETLRARMSREGALPVADAVKVLREVLDALAFAHEHGVVHRDIKPENILIEAGHALVADFGIAKALRESGNMTSAGIALGTPTYMAPEQATADPTTDHRADLYSVGVLAYELFVGRPPFSGSAQQVITAHITTPAPPVQAHRADVPDGVAGVIASALAKEPSARPQSALEMSNALDEIVTTPNGTISRRAPASPAWKRTPVLATAAVIAIAAVGVFTWRARSAAATPVVAEGADLIAVMPLGAASDTSLARLGQDLVVTISANLDGVGALRSIDAATLLMRARKLPSPMPLADAQQLATELGARSVLTGTLVSEGDRVRASVVLRLVGGDSVLARANALAAPRDIAAITDSLSWSVLQQVWRRGTPPSPVLTGLTTASFDALRAFLDGERRFQRLDPQGALADYRRAFELDSNFVQTYLRYDYVNDWSLRAPDAVVHHRLLALKDRLPERERLWVETRERALPVPARVAEWKSLSARYPDYPPFLMAAADAIVHFGPIYGIPIGDARPMLDRLDQLVPDHADTKLHQAAVTNILGTALEAADASDVAAASMSGPYAKFQKLAGDLVRAKATGAPMPSPERALEVARAMATESGSPAALLFAGLFGFRNAPPAWQVDAIGRVRRAGIYVGDQERATGFGESALRTARGDWMGALDAARRTEQSMLPMSMRLSAARVAGLGAWLEAIDPAVADSALRRARALPMKDASAIDRAELRWLDGVVGVAVGDSSRVQDAIKELTADTSLLGRHSARSLAGLWLNRSKPDAAADSLRAVTDDVMRNGAYLLSAESLSRLVIARGLRKRGENGAVERYVMWTDGALNSPHLIGTQSAVGPFAEFERAAAFDALGNRDAAIKYYRTVVDNYDQPPAAHRAMVDEAKQRLAVLEKTDAPKAKAVPR